MNEQDQQTLDNIKRGFQNAIPRIIKSGDKVVITQGGQTITLPIAQSVPSSTILR